MGKLIGFDQDPAAIGRCEKLFSKDARVILRQKNFRFIDETLQEMKIETVDAILFDIGMSSDQLAEGDRGFSFQKPGDLDMRMNPNKGAKASDYVARLPESELARIFYEYGEERRSRRFARAIIEERRKTPIETTQHLVQVIGEALPGAKKFRKSCRVGWAPRNPATKVFQALRILTNDELGALRDGIDGAWKWLSVGGRLAVISFHSLEDRIVKKKFRDLARQGLGNLITRKPVVAKRSEIIDNPRARSAKLRVIEKKS